MIGTEHLLLGLAMEKEGTAGVVLRAYGVEEEELRILISELIEPEAEFIRHAKHPAGKKKNTKEPKPGTSEKAEEAFLEYRSRLPQGD